MQESLYTDLIKEFLPTLVLAWEQTYNGENQDEPIYLHDEYSSREYSVAGDFASIEVDNAVPMAYVTDMDSPFPLIRQEGAAVVSGEIPKITAEMQFTEKKLTEIHTLNLQLAGAQGRMRDSIEDQIITKLFKPMKKLYLAQKERLEFMFKQGLSYGVTTIDPTNNVGAGVLIDFGYKPENKFGATIPWTTLGYKPLDDIRKMDKKAKKDRRRITEYLMLQETYDLLLNSDQAKGLVFPLVDLANVAYLDANAFNSAFLANFGATIKIVENNETVQQNGVNVDAPAWKVGTIVGITEKKTASLVWARLAEDLDRAKQADYETIEEFILLRKYKTVHPTYGEFDSSQSRSLIVVKNNVYTLDTTATL